MSVSRFFSVVERWLWLLFIRSSKLKNSSTKWQSFWRVDDLNRAIILPLPTDLIERPVLGICDDSWILPLIISPLVPLRPLVALRPALTSSIRSLHLTIPAASLSLFCPEHNTRRRSLLMLVLSHSHTHHLNRHMVGCGCHEILIQRCIIFPLFSNSSLYPIQLWLWWLSYLNLSFQLISIQYGFHHSDPPRNHRSCYQGPFILTSHWRQAHIQRHISCCHSSKACESVASTVYKTYRSAKSNALAIPKRSQNYLPYNRKDKRHEPMTVTSINII